jgi:hypothetical protein
MIDKSVSTKHIFKNKILKKHILLPKLMPNYNFNHYSLNIIQNKILKKSFSIKNFKLKKDNPQLKFNLLITNINFPNASLINKTNNNHQESNLNSSNEIVDKNNFEHFNFLNHNNSDDKRKLNYYFNENSSKKKFKSNKNLSDTISLLNDTSKIINQINIDNKQNIIIHNFPPVPTLIKRKEIDKIPICPIIPLTYKHQFSSLSEYNRFIKFNEELLKLKEQIKIDSKNCFKYLKEFMNYNGIKKDIYYTNKYLCNLSNFIKSDFCNSINPNITLQENIIIGLKQGSIDYTGLKEEEKEKNCINPYIKEEKKEKNNKISLKLFKFKKKNEFINLLDEETQKN